MAAPAVVAALRAAAAILTDEKARTAALSIIVGIIAAILLPIIMLICIITMPFAQLGDVFSGGDYDQIVEFRNAYGFDQ